MLLIALWAALGAGAAGVLTPVAWRLTQASSRVRGPVSVAVLTATTAFLFGMLAWRVHTYAELFGYSVTAAVAVPLSAIDLTEQRLPSVLLLPAYPAVIASATTEALQHHDSGTLVRALLGMIGSFLFFLAIALASRGGLGAGDVRLAGLLGFVLAWHSWATLVSGTFLGLLSASAAGGIVIIAGQANGRSPIPLGPALIAGAMVAVLIPLG
jgi:leader peptidase (prepilin peptidase)/N-methyltransferase